MKNIIVVHGGNSNERAISFKSSISVVKALKDLGYKVQTFDPFKKKYSELKKMRKSIIFNSLHGFEGEDGVAQSYFEYLKIPYTHSGVISSMISMNKLISKEFFIKRNILTPKFVSLMKSNFNAEILKKEINKKKIKFPVVVKPISEGSSIGVKICKNFKDCFSQTIKLFKNYDNLILENFIGGQEVQVAVLNGKAIGAIELIPKRKFYDYKAKYTKKAKTRHVMPAKLNKIEYNKILKIAEKAHKLLGCRGVTRSDFKVYNNKCYLLELNTQPGMTNLSLVPEIARFKGITFNNLVKKIINDAGLNK